MTSGTPRTPSPTCAPSSSRCSTRPKGGYADGSHEKPAPGRYRTASSGPSCTWQVTDAKGGILTSGPAPGAKDGQHTLTIPSGAAGFESSGCYAWLRA